MSFRSACTFANSVSGCWEKKQAYEKKVSLGNSDNTKEFFFISSSASHRQHNKTKTEEEETFFLKRHCPPVNMAPHSV